MTKEREVKYLTEIINQRLADDPMVKLLKRDEKSVVEYNPNKVLRAIKNAMKEDEVFGVDEETAKLIEQGVYDELLMHTQLRPDVILTVESVQDMIENGLLKHGRIQTAKDYMQFRSKRDEERGNPNSDENVKEYIYLTDDFISDYKHLPDPMKPIGSLTFYRTYSRWLKKRKRREKWYETVRRAVEYNMSLVEHKDHEKAVQEAQQLFMNIYYMRQFLSGRTFYSGNTKVTEQFPTANYNCAFTIIDGVQAFVDTFYLLMLGCGLGFRQTFVDLEKLQKFNSNIEMIHAQYKAKPFGQRSEHTDLTFNQFGNIAILTIGDSKLGWIKGLQFLLMLYTDRAYQNVDTIMIDYDNVRVEGEKLFTFGGNASGHEALKNIFENIQVTVQNRKEELGKDGYINLEPIDALDIQTGIATGVVVGGTRRSAEICLMDPNDKVSMEAKSELYVKVNGEWEIDRTIAHRQMSNNSIYYTEKPTREQLHWQIEAMRYSGEPAWVNAEAGAERRPNFNGVNPCGEILLDNKGFCNLTTINAYAFVTEDGKLDEQGLLNAQRMSARAGYRMASIELELHEWNIVQQRDKLIGCSLTGWQDMVNAVGLSKDDQRQLLRKLRKVAHEASEELATELNSTPPLLATTVKPEGTLSLLPTVSSGVHYSHSPYYIRRIRISSFNPLCKTMEELGYPIFPEVGQDWETCKTKVVEFPVKAPQGLTKYDVSAIEQLENYKMFMEDYVDHNCSITVHVRDHEWKEVEEWVWNNWKLIVGVSFLSLDDSFYELLPYEAIDEEEYNKRVSELKEFDVELYASFEKEEWEEEDLDGAECASGSCPTR